MRGAESDIPLTDRVSEVSLQRQAISHVLWHGLKYGNKGMAQHTTDFYLAAGKHTIIPSNCKGAAGKVIAEVSLHQAVCPTSRPVLTTHCGIGP